VRVASVTRRCSARARGDNRADSGIDIMLEFDPVAHITVFDCAGLKDYIVGLFHGPVDVINREALKPYLRPVATTDAIYAFGHGVRGAARDCAPHRNWPSGSRPVSTTKPSRDRRTVYAATRCLEIISEAARRIPDTTSTAMTTRTLPRSRSCGADRPAAAAFGARRRVPIAARGRQRHARNSCFVTPDLVICGCTSGGSRWMWRHGGRRWASNNTSRYLAKTRSTTRSCPS
jgi:uncharacterized protein